MHPDIERYQSDPLYAYLNKRLITLDGKPPHIPKREILLMESCSLLAFKLGSLRSQIERRADDGMNVVLNALYAPLAASSFGDVPTADEFLAMPTDDIYKWTQEAREVNSGFFEWLDSVEQLGLTEEEKKKKLPKRRRSARG